MAAGGAGAAQDLCAELLCPICLGYFNNPVTIAECGHNFCQSCLSDHCRELGREAGCLQCGKLFQKENLITNRPLANLVEIAKKLQEGKRTEGGSRICGKHQEPLRLFCKDDEVLICLVCDRAKEHRGHQVIPLEEAPPDYKEKIASCLKSLKKLQEEICKCKAETEKKSQDLLKQTQTDREKTMLEFRRLHEFLDIQEKHLLAQIKGAEKEIASKRDEHMAKLSEKLSCLEDTIREMEEKCLQPASEFLQDIKSTLQRYEAQKEFQKPVVFSLELKWRIWEFWDISPFLEGVMKQFKGKLLSGLTLRKVEGHSSGRERKITKVNYQIYRSCFQEQFGFFNPVFRFLENGLRENDELHHATVETVSKWSPTKKTTEEKSCAKVTLDPNTSHPMFILSAGDKHIDIGKSRLCASSPERFDKVLCVLGREQFIAGRHYWEFYVPTDKRWGVGVARKSARRNGVFECSPEQGFWLVRNCKTAGHPGFPVQSEAKKVHVQLNCEGGRVAIFDADTAALLYAFPTASFSGETLLPVFHLCKITP